jgi:hypothetical protein
MVLRLAAAEQPYNHDFALSLGRAMQSWSGHAPTGLVAGRGQVLAASATAWLLKQSTAMEVHAWARRVDELAAPWPGDRDLQLERARAWRWVSWAFRGNGPAYDRTIILLREIVDRFASDQQFQSELAQALTYRAF